MIWMQALWFSAVLGAADELVWPALVVLLLFASWQLQPMFRRNSDIRLIPISIILGVVLDSTWIKLGWIEFAAPKPINGFAPYWIIALWAGLALNINHSMAWLKTRLLAAASIGALLGPFSYLAAQHLGALRVISESWDWFFGLALSWGLVIPFLLYLADHPSIKKQGQVNV